jgi:hypothetical protein
MSVAELVLDYIQALIWPALVVVGVFWLFRSQLRSLLAEMRVKTIKGAGFEVELEQVAEALKKSVEESREQAAKAEDPEERERAVEKLERDAAALGQVEAVREASQTDADRRAKRVVNYVSAVGELADARLSKEGLPPELALGAIREASREYLDAMHRRRRAESPESFVDEWFAELMRERGQPDG